MPSNPTRGGASAPPFSLPPRKPFSGEPRKRFRARCGACEHQWVALYTPMPLFKSARVLGSLHCPRCGQDASKIFCLKADAG